MIYVRAIEKIEPTRTDLKNDLKNNLPKNENKKNDKSSEDNFDKLLQESIYELKKKAGEI